MTNLKNLCVDLVDALTAHGQPDDAAVGYVAGLLTRARAALAEPEPEGPTDEELLEEWRQLMGSPRAVLAQPMLDFARAVLARWNNYPASPDSSTSPRSEND